MLVLLPWHGDDINLSAWACEPCAGRLGIVCPLHGVHTGFSGGGHACLDCIEVQTQEYYRNERNPTQFLASFAPSEEWEVLTNFVLASRLVRGDPSWVCVLRLLVTVAHQYNTPVEEFMVELYDHGSIGRLLYPNIPIPDSLPP